MPGHYGNRTTRTSRMRTSNGNGRNTLMTRAGQFRNRRTGQPVPANMPYHIHPERGAMQGATHNPDIPGGQAGHDFYDAINGMNGNGMNGNGMNRNGMNGNGMNGNGMGNMSSMHGSGAFFFEDTGQPYSGQVVNVGGVMYSTTDGVYSGNSRPLVQHSIRSQANVNPMTGVTRSPSRRRAGTRRTSNLRSSRAMRMNGATQTRSSRNLANRRRTPSNVRTTRRTTTMSTPRMSPMRRGGSY